MSTDERRVIAIQCVAELDRGVRVLDGEVAGGRSVREVRRTLAGVRRVLQLLDESVARDGRDW